MSVATLNGHRVTNARVNIPAWGCWYADASIDGEHELAGPVTLVIADLTLKGAVISGGPAKGRSEYRIVAGAGGWGRDLPSKPYVNDAGVKKATVLGDAAREAGETLADIPAADRVGPAWTRQAGPASRDLHQLAERAWYVDEAGVTRLGARAAGALVGTATRVSAVDLARGKLVLASEKIATILPGLVVDGLTAVDVLHELGPDGLRSTVWGTQTASTLDTLRKIDEQLDPRRAASWPSSIRIRRARASWPSRTARPRPGSKSSRTASAPAGMP